MEPFALVALVVATFLLAGLVKGVVGMGLPPVAIGIMALTMPPAQAAALVLVPAFVTNIWQMSPGRSLIIIVRRLWPLLVCICIGVWLCRDVMTTQASKLPELLLGVMLMLYAVYGAVSVTPRIPPRYEPYAAPIVGLTTGVILAATGLMQLPLFPYLQAINLEKEEMLQALGLSFFISALALGTALASASILRTETALMSLFALLPAAAGMALGRYYVRRISAAAFKRWFLIAMFLIGLASFVQAIR
ncbi:MAG: sulfite exporter TauE/SafE family protein [Afipia sp.]